jgi:hypothetical protein
VAAQQHPAGHMQLASATAYNMLSCSKRPAYNLIQNIASSRFINFLQLFFQTHLK